MIEEKRKKNIIDRMSYSNKTMVMVQLLDMGIINNEDGLQIIDSLAHSKYANHISGDEIMTAYMCLLNKGVLDKAQFIERVGLADFLEVCRS